MVALNEALLPVGSQQDMIRLLGQRRVPGACDEEDGCPVSRASRATSSSAGFRPVPEMTSSRSFFVKVAAKARVFSGMALATHRLPRLPNLTEASSAMLRLWLAAATSTTWAAFRQASAARSWSASSACTVARTSSCLLMRNFCRMLRIRSG